MPSWDCIRAKSAHGFGICSECTIQFFSKKCLKNALYKNVFQTKVDTHHNTQLLVQKLFLIAPRIWPLPWLHKSVFGESALKMCCTKKIFRQKLLQITICNFDAKFFLIAPTGLTSALIEQIVFFGEKYLKNVLYKKVFQTKVVTNYNTQLSVPKFFWLPHRFGLCPDCTIRFFGESAFKMCCTKKKKFKTKVVINQKPQLLCYVTFFDILCHFGVIVASQIGYVAWVCQESIVPSYGTDFSCFKYNNPQFYFGSSKLQTDDTCKCFCSCSFPLSLEFPPRLDNFPRIH